MSCNKPALKYICWRPPYEITNIHLFQVSTCIQIIMSVLQHLIIFFKEIQNTNLIVFSGLQIYTIIHNSKTETPSRWNLHKYTPKGGATFHPLGSVLTPLGGGSYKHLHPHQITRGVNVFWFCTRPPPYLFLHPAKKIILPSTLGCALEC